MLTVPDRGRAERWTRVAPYTTPTTLPITGTREVRKDPRARARLGLPEDGKLALLFGTSHKKRSDVVVNAFADLPDWTLVIGGEVASGVAHEPSFPGVVSDETRDQLFSAADLVVLSFSPGYRNSSGTLMDAISFGIPVVCTQDSDVGAHVVATLRVGALFDGDRSASLVEAVRRAERDVDPGDIDAAREQLSNVALARRQLVAVGVDPPIAPLR